MWMQTRYYHETMHTCLKCDTDVSELVGFDTLTETIICPACSHPMVVCYDEIYDAQSGDEWGWFWVEEVQ